MGVRISTVVNGAPTTIEVPAHRRLVDLLRGDLGLTGTKESCGIGVCGACSVTVDGRLVSACLTLAALVDGRSVTTIEGLAGPDGTLSPLQQAFLDHGGLQCGACTPGQLMAATALLAEHPDPDEARVREWMTGNLCRCTGYRGIVESVLAAAAERRGDPSAGETTGSGELRLGGDSSRMGDPSRATEAPPAGGPRDPGASL